MRREGDDCIGELTPNHNVPEESRTSTSPASKMARIIEMLRNAKPDPVPDIELFSMSGDLMYTNEYLYHKPSTDELGVVKSPFTEPNLRPITKGRRYCRAGIRTSDYGILCTDDEPLRAYRLLGEEIVLPQETFDNALQIAKAESPYGYEIDLSSMIEYIEFSRNNVYLGTGYHGPLYKARLEEFISGRALYEKIAKCNNFEDLAVDGDIISYASDQEIFVIRGEKRTTRKLDDTIYRLFRVLNGDALKFIAVTERAIEIRNLDMETFEWREGSVNYPHRGYLQSFSFIHGGILFAEEGEGQFVVIDLETGNSESLELAQFQGLPSRDHFNRVILDESQRKMYLLMKHGTYVANM